VKTFDALFEELSEKASSRPTGSSTVAELDAGVHAIGKKIVEEAAEVWMAAEHEGKARTAEEMTELPPAAMAALVQQAPQMGVLGEFFLRCFGAFEFDGIEPVLPKQTFSGELSLRVGGRELALGDHRR